MEGQKIDVVDKGVRFQNYAVDLVIVIMVATVVLIIINIIGLPDVLTLPIMQGTYFLYYFLMEYKYQQTVGKRFTRTVVVNKFGGKITTKELAIRTAFRIIGLDVLSFLLGNNVGMHDLFSNTRVIKLKEYKELVHKQKNKTTHTTV